MKLTIIGRGNAGCITAMYFSHFRNYLDTPLEIELIYDSNIMPVPTGQGTALEFTDTMTRCFDSSYIDKFPSTIKTGIMYENLTPPQIENFNRRITSNVAALQEAENILGMISDSVGPYNSVKSFLSNNVKRCMSFYQFKNGRNLIRFYC